MEWIMQHWWIGLISIPLGILLIIIGMALATFATNEDSALAALIALLSMITGWLSAVLGKIWLVISIIVWVVLTVVESAA